MMNCDLLTTSQPPLQTTLALPVPATIFPSEHETHPVPVISDLELLEGYFCDCCDTTRDVHAGPLFECQGKWCGKRFSIETSYDSASNRCPDCAKFSTRLADYACAECHKYEVVVYDVIECPECADLIEACSEAWADHWAEWHER